MRTRAGYGAAGKLIVGLLFFALIFGSLAWGEGTAGWEAGTYWTYDATLTFQDGRAYRFPITLIVLGGDTHFGMESRDLAGIYESHGGGKIVGVLRMIGPIEIYLRWPAILGFIPGSTASSASYLAHQAAAIPLSPDGSPYDSYEIALTSFGLLSQEEIIDRLSAALSAMEISDPEGAGRIRELLEGIGFAVP